MNRLLHFPLFFIPSLVWLPYSNFKKAKTREKNNLSVCFLLDMAGSILLYFGPRRSVVCSSQPRRPTGVGKKNNKKNPTTLPRAPVQILTFCVSILSGKSGGQDEKQRYGIEDNLHLGDRDRELRVCVFLFSTL